MNTGICTTIGRQPPEQRLGDRAQIFPGYPNDPDPAPSRRRCDRRDDIGGRVQRFAAALPPSIMRLICHCWAIERMLLTNQYSTSPEGKKKNMMPNANGMIIITLACTGSGGVGFIFVCTSIDTIISAGSTYQGSCADRSVIQR